MTRGKGQKRAPRKEIDPVGDDFANLAAVIAEHKLDTDASGWFALPWRDGWNAIELLRDEWAWAINAYTHAHGLPSDHGHCTANNIFSGSLSMAYNRAAELLASHEWFFPDEQPDSLEWIPVATPMMRAALRCLQLYVARSDAGGWAYGEYLRQAYQHGGTAELVRKWRCHDALGVFPALQNDEHDRARRAFITAWDAGLYHAAYAIKPVMR